MGCYILLCTHQSNDHCKREPHADIQTKQKGKLTFTKKQAQFSSTIHNNYIFNSNQILNRFITFILDHPNMCTEVRLWQVCTCNGGTTDSPQATTQC